MPEPVQTKNVYEALPQARPQAIVVYCSAPRFQTAFEQFIAKDLGLAKGQFIPLVIAGGAGVLAHPERLPKEFKFMRDRFELFRRNYDSVKRIVLINHEDCAYYKSLTERISGLLGGHAQDPTRRSREDMELIANVFDRLLSHLGLEVELYYAHFVDGDQSKVAFDRMH
jgi:hypothetical protein